VGVKVKSVIICNLCGETKDYLRKEIGGKEYDISSEAARINI
jgi:hypothetical protein